MSHEKRFSYIRIRCTVHAPPLKHNDLMEDTQGDCTASGVRVSVRREIGNCLSNPVTCQAAWSCLSMTALYSVYIHALKPKDSSTTSPAASQMTVSLHPLARSGIQSTKGWVVRVFAISHERNQKKIAAGGFGICGLHRIWVNFRHFRLFQQGRIHLGWIEPGNPLNMLKLSPFLSSQKIIFR